MPYNNYLLKPGKPGKPERCEDFYGLKWIDRDTGKWTNTINLANDRLEGDNKLFGK